MKLSISATLSLFLDVVKVVNVTYELTSSQTAKAMISWAIEADRELPLSKYRIKFSNDAFKEHEIEWPG